MILLFNKSKITKPVIVNSQISTEELSTKNDSRSFTTAPKSFSATKSWVVPPAIPDIFKYPISVEDLFPYWLRYESAGVTGSLIELTTMYYDWLTCNSGDINNLSFLNLESIISTNSPRNITLVESSDPLTSDIILGLKPILEDFNPFFSVISLNLTTVVNRY